MLRLTLVAGSLSCLLLILTLAVMGSTTVVAELRLTKGERTLVGNIVKIGNKSLFLSCEGHAISLYENEQKLEYISATCDNRTGGANNSPFPSPSNPCGNSGGGVNPSGFVISDLVKDHFDVIDSKWEEIIEQNPNYDKQYPIPAWSSQFQYFSVSNGLAVPGTQFVPVSDVYENPNGVSPDEDECNDPRTGPDPCINCIEKISNFVANNPGWESHFWSPSSKKMQDLYENIRESWSSGNGESVEYYVDKFLWPRSILRSIESLPVPE